MRRLLALVVASLLFVFVPGPAGDESGKDGGESKCGKEAGEPIG